MKTAKHVLPIFLTLVLLLGLAGCGGASGGGETPVPDETQTSTQTQAVTPPASDTQNSNTDTAASQPEQIPETADQTGNSNVLVLYFSRTGEQYVVGVIDKGNTAIVAEMIAEQTGADLFEILPADDHYPMTYAELTDVAKQEQNEQARPAYAGELPELSQYDTVFIGAPVWWGDWPMILYTVFENNDFSGKTLIPFSTHEGSGLSGFDRKLASACPDSTVLDGLAVRGNEAQNDREQVQSAVKDWITGLGF